MKRSLKSFIVFSSSVLLASCANSHSSGSLPAVSAPNTTNKMALRIYEKLPMYAAASKMSWQPIQKNNIQFSKIARERLTALGMMSSNDSLKAGIREFQRDNGLNATGAVNQATLNALNILPAQRYRALVKSMNEWARYPEDAASRYIQVNIPSYDFRLISEGRDVLQMKVIVGRPSRPTPLLNSKITTVVFNPTWTVPKTILSKDVIPGMRENPNYLEEHYDMHIYANHENNAPEINPVSIDWQTATLSNFRYRVTAPASDVNPLGRVKFIFSNDQDVYMHDTPEKAIFALNDRARSSGCIRLENPLALVEYFYSDDADLTADKAKQYLSTYTTRYVQLRHPMPIYITYILSWVDSDGRAHFAPDIYETHQVNEQKEMKSTIA